MLIRIHWSVAILALLAVTGVGRAQITVVSAASFDADGVLAPGSIASAFGQDLAPAVEAASSASLPTSLQGIRVTVTDLALQTMDCPLFFVSPTQINFLLPEGLAEGPATVRVRQAAGLAEEAVEQTIAEGTITLTVTAPGLFNQTDLNWAAAFLLRIAADGTRTRESIYHAPNGVIVPRTIELSDGNETDQFYLELYGTGFANAGGVENVLTLVGNSATSRLTAIDTVPTLYAGPQGGFQGLDQVTAGPLTRRLEFFGGGDAPIVMFVGDRPSNVVWMNIAPNPNAPTISNLDFQLNPGSPPTLEVRFDFTDADGDIGPFRMIITWEDEQRFCTVTYDLAAGPYTGDTSGSLLVQGAKGVGTQLGPIVSALVTVSDDAGHISNIIEWMPDPAGSLTGFAEQCDTIQEK